MASALTSLGSLPVLVRASGQPDPNRMKSVSYSPPSAWWAPLYGCSSYPDYVNTKAGGDGSVKHSEECDPDAGRPRPRFARGCFTEEKARQLRRKTVESVSFHDVMYHSAIAARLASDLSGRPEK